MAKSTFQRGDAIPAEWLNEVARAVLDRVTVVGPGRAKRIGNSLSIEIDYQPRGKSGGDGSVFPVLLEQRGGGPGSDTEKASFTYRVTHALTGEQLYDNVNPSEGIHKWARMNPCYMLPAYFGYAHTDNDGHVVIGWINEVPGTERCQTVTVTPE